MENVVNDTQASVVETPTFEAAAESGTEQVQTADIAPRPQSASDNARFRKLRLENERLRSENERLEDAEIDRLMQHDLERIQKLAPDVASLEELGEPFGRLIAAGVDAPVAFAALRQVSLSETPPSLGAVDGGASGVKEFYTPNEVDALSDAELDDPNIWRRVRRSMTKW